MENAWKNRCHADNQSIEIPKSRGSDPLVAPSGLEIYHGSRDASLFSSSLPVLRYGKLNCMDANHDIHAVANVPSNQENVEGKDSHDDLDVNAIGSLLPGDEDDLLAGITDDFGLRELPNQLEDLEEDDVFCSGGGMEMDSDPTEKLSVAMARTNLVDGFVSNGTPHYSIPNGGVVAGEHPFGEHPSRTLFVRNINSNVEDSELRALFEQHGDIRTLYTACKHRGFVMISYYDIRAARTAMRALQNKPLRRRKLDIHFSIPKDNPSEKDVNQGTLVAFNLDPSVSNDDLCQIFGNYGEVKEIRETPHKRHHKFIEFYDVRAAEAALRALNRSDIAGKRIKLEPSRPGGARRSMIQQWNQELEQEDARSFRHQVGSPIANSPPGTWVQFGSPGDGSPLQALSQSPTLGAINPMPGNSMHGLASILPPKSNSIKIPPIGKDHSRGNYLDWAFNGFNTHGVPFQQSHSFPEHSTGILSNINSSPQSVSSFGQSTPDAPAVGTLTGPQFLWGNRTPYSDQPHSSGWAAPSVGHSFKPNGQGKGIPYSSHHNSFRTSSQSYIGHHVGSAPPGVPLERNFGYFHESPDTSFMNPGAFGAMGFNRSDGGLMMNFNAQSAIASGVGISTNMPENGSSGFRMIPSQRMGHMFINSGPYSALGSNVMESLIERGRNRKVENNGNQVDSKKQYQLELDKIISGEDNRTTLMIKNIPNKYTSKMLLAAIDENHKGTYDFLYLPIDFKNKCNVGYAFINMVSAAHIIPFYEAFNGKKWEKFNSEKVASLAYARIQGKAALVSHFQNSSLMNEDKRCRPILFRSEGPDAGNQEPFPSNKNIITADSVETVTSNSCEVTEVNGQSGSSAGER